MLEPLVNVLDYSQGGTERSSDREENLRTAIQNCFREFLRER